MSGIKNKTEKLLYSDNDKEKKGIITAKSKISGTQFREQTFESLV
jgi:hypothetical protein